MSEKVVCSEQLTSFTDGFYRPDVFSDGKAPLHFDFPSAADARVYIQDKVDVPARDNEVMFDDRIRMHIFPQDLPDGRFTNVYDMSYRPEMVCAGLRITRSPRSVADFISDFPPAIAAASGAFLFLADVSSGTPRQAALNLALRRYGRAASLPVTDREALIDDGQRFSARMIRAVGEVAIGGNLLSWSGSRTDYDTDTKVFSNGNVVIRHTVIDDMTARKQRIRVLDESSRLTPELPRGSGMVDLGLLADTYGRMQVRATQEDGGMDMFDYDVVLRCAAAAIQGTVDEVRFLSVDSLALDGRVHGALSVGPMLDDPAFENNAINADPSLGSDPPFADVPMVRLAVFEAADGTMHLTLFDGRPESGNFKGVTPREAVKLIREKDEVVWGCFLDPGRTAKLATRTNRTIMTYGNAHYLQWPAEPGGRYVWVPGTGRPVPSAITLE